jgi:hypothetical protein
MKNFTDSTKTNKKVIWDLMNEENHSTFPQSNLISRLEAFIPRIKEANELLSDDKENINMENISNDNLQVIEFDLGIGVYDVNEGYEGLQEIHDIPSDIEEEEEEEEDFCVIEEI